MTRWFSWGPYTAIEEPLRYIERLEEQRARGEQLDLIMVHRERGPAGITGLSEFSGRDHPIGEAVEAFEDVGVRLVGHGHA